jgi:hypothetical protein
MSYFMIDVEVDGPIPGDYSMIELGAILVRSPLEEAPTFHARLRPLPDADWDDEALKVTGWKRGETQLFDWPIDVMLRFTAWIREHNVGKRPMFVSDNNGFDFMFVSWYFHHFMKMNPFGHTSTNLGSLYKGQVRDTFKNFKHLRITPHTHNPVDDARGNAEALLAMQRSGLTILLE